MKKTGMEILEELVRRYPQLAVCREEIAVAADRMTDCYRNGGKLLICGNGGSASDALHIVGELMKSFVLPRKLSEDDLKAFRASGARRPEYLHDNLQGALPAIALVSETSLQTAYANDVAPELAFAQQVWGLGNAGDVLLGITTSGNSENVVCAAEVARAKGMTVVALTGALGGKMKAVSDVTIAVPDTETYRIQELHLEIKKLLAAESPENRALIITVIGGQGHIFGRGNQQLSPEVIKMLPRENIIVAATPAKMAGLFGKCLIADTGDAELDEELKGYVPVVTGHARRIMTKIG